MSYRQDTKPVANQPMLAHRTRPQEWRGPLFAQPKDSDAPGLAGLVGLTLVGAGVLYLLLVLLLGWQP